MSWVDPTDRDGMYLENFTGLGSSLWGLWAYKTEHKMKMVPEAFVYVCLKLWKPELETSPSVNFYN